MNILIIDDDIFLQKTLSFSLLREGHTVTIAEDGQEAIDNIEKQRNYDLLICDVKMPTLSGPTFILMLKKYYPKKMPVIIIVSGVKEGEDFLKKIDIKYDHFFSKPLDYDKLRDVVKKINLEKSPL